MSGYTASPSSHRSRRRISNRTLALVTTVVAGRVADITMSAIALSHGAGELNPLARGLWAQHQIMGLVALTLVGLTLAFIIVAIMPVWKRAALVAMCVTSWLPVALNVAIVTGLVRP